MHPVLDTVALNGRTMRGWLERKVKGYKKMAAGLRDDAGTQAEPEAKLYDDKAKVVEEILADLERSEFQEGGTGLIECNYRHDPGCICARHALEARAECAKLKTKVEELQSDKSCLEFDQRTLITQKANMEFELKGTKHQLKAIRKWLGQKCDEASTELNGMNPKLPLAAKYGGRLRLAQELAQKLDAGDFEAK